MDRRYLCVFSIVYLVSCFTAANGITTGMIRMVTYNYDHDDNDNDDDGDNDDVYADYTTIIVVSSVVGAVVLIALICAVQFVR